MSGTKRHLEDLADKHAMYVLQDDGERTAWRYAVLDCAGRILERMHAPETELEECLIMGKACGELHDLYDELVGVDTWAPPKKRFEHLAL